MQKLKAIQNTTWLYIVVSLFIAINTMLIYKEFFYFGILAVALGIAFIALVRLDVLMYMIVFLTPLSVPLRVLVPTIENDIILPTEPLILVLLLVFIIKLIQEKKFDLKIITHPVSAAIFLNLSWMLLTAITSTMPIVSFKFLASRIWFLVAYFFMLSQIFRNYKNIERFYWLFSMPLLAVIIFAIARHSIHGLSNQEAAHFVSSPFFNDHTAYGVILAMVYPLVLHFFFQKGNTMLYKVFSLSVLILFTMAIVLSYTRATWLSLAISLGIYIIIKFRIKFIVLFSVALVAGIIIISSWSQIMMKLEKNSKESSDYLIEHVQSMSNVTSDASNLERINRWSCAIRMFKEKPVIGWGPGTYTFTYGRFQLDRQKTIISTNAGTLGNAHSEYLGPLSEMGALGTLSFLAIIVLTLIYGIRLYHRAIDKETKSLIIALIIGLCTYYIHGVLNNFLDTDKASCLFWGFTAVLVTLEVHHKDKFSAKN